MKDLSLSLLSRGCGRIVPSNRNKGRHDRRLDVCFTPQDYYIWKSQDSVLKLSDRGRLLVKETSTVPKTYSTRRGPLVLYSQDLITIENGCYPQTVRRQPVVQQHSQQVEQQLNNLKELTTAILSYSNEKFTFSRHVLPSFPPLPPPLAPNLHCSSPPPIPTTQESCQELVERFNPQRIHTERNTKQLENHAEDEEEKQVDMKPAELDLLQEIPCTSRALTPQVRVPCGSVTNEEEAQLYSGESLQHNGDLQHTEIKHRNKRAELHHPNLNHAHDSADTPGCFIQERETTSERDDHERSVSGNRHGTGLLPPVTVENPVSQRPRWGEMDGASWGIPSRDGPHALILPPIAENQTVVSSWTFPSATTKDQPKAERVCLQSPKNLNQNHQQPLLFPLLFPEKKEEKNGKQREEREKTRRQHFLKERVGQTGGGGRLPSGKGSLIQLERGEVPPPPVGVLGCVAGRRGPGKQSSLASLQNQLADFQDPCEHGEANRGVVRGVLPLELRDLQNGKCVGCLILGPDGEIIQLSMYDKSQDQDQDPSQGDGDTSDMALQVLSAEGEGLPWVIVLQPEHTFTVCAEGEVELNADVPIENIQQFEKLLGPHGLSETNTRSPINHKEQVFKSKSNSAAAVTETWKASKKDPKIKNRMSPLREHVKEKGPGSHNSEDDGEEELGSTDLSGSQQPGEKLQFQENAACREQNIDKNVESAERAAKKKKTDTTRKVADKAAITAGKKEIKPGINEESDAQKKIRMKKEEKWHQQQTGSDAQLTQSHKQEMTTDRERERGEVKMDEKKEKQRQEERQKKESAERRGAGLKHKELVVEKHEDSRENVHEKIKQEIEEESHPKPAEAGPTKQKYKNKTKTHSEEDADHLSHDADKHSGVQSSGSLRSTAAASQFSHKSLRKSAVSLSEGTVASSRGRLSSCSTVMVTEEQLMLNPVKPESSRNGKSQKEEEAAALLLAEQEDKRRQEVERKRMEREEEERKRLEKEQTEARMKSELEEERRKRAEELRLKRFAKEEERRKREEEEQEQVRQQQAQRERERRRQEDRRKQMEQLRLMREKEEQRRKAELERLRMEELRRQEEENKKLQEMDESEREEYLQRKEQEEEERRTKDEERRRAEEEAALLAAEEAKLQADLLARQMALLQQQLAFKRSLELEAEGLEKTQGISRPWVYSYLTLLQLVGPTNAETTTL